jgi:hypothetical protein
LAAAANGAAAITAPAASAVSVDDKASLVMVMSVSPVSSCLVLFGGFVMEVGGRVTRADTIHGEPFCLSRHVVMVWVALSRGGRYTAEPSAKVAHTHGRKGYLIEIQTQLMPATRPYNELTG